MLLIRDRVLIEVIIENKKTHMFMWYIYSTRQESMYVYFMGKYKTFLKGAP